jgi:hypothetical protein
MKATNTLLLLVLLLLSPRFVSAQDDVQQRKDSLLKGIVQAQQQHNLDLENSSKFKLLALMFNNQDYDDFT